MELIQRTLNYIKTRRENVIQGNVNCIPSPFPSFRTDFVGTEQKTYYLISGNQKSGKTQFTSYVFIYNNILYAYSNQDKVRLKIFYIPLEETPELITMRFMCFLLFTMSNHKIRISTKELQSTIENHPVDSEVIQILESEPYMKILDFFEKSITFITETNPTGVYKAVTAYADTHGKRVFKKIQVTNKDTGQVESFDKFDHYEPNDPKEYVEIVADHVSLLSPESGMDLRNTIAKFSSYMVEMRNKYGYIPVVIQQQTAEAQGLEAQKLNRLRPSASGLGDGKNTSRDCDVMLGVFNPYAFELKTYGPYDITKLKDCQRFLEVILNRHGQSNGLKALYFDGAVSFFSELPSDKDSNYVDFMENVYALIERNKETDRRKFAMLIWSKVRKLLP